MGTLNRSLLKFLPFLAMAELAKPDVFTLQNFNSGLNYEPLAPKKFKRNPCKEMHPTLKERKAKRREQGKSRNINHHKAKVK